MSEKTMYKLPERNTMDSIQFAKPDGGWMAKAIQNIPQSEDAPQIDVKSLVSPREANALRRCAYVFVEFGGQMHAVRPDDRVPEGSRILRQKNNQIVAIAAVTGG